MNGTHDPLEMALSRIERAMEIQVDLTLGLLMATMAEFCGPEKRININSLIRVNTEQICAAARELWPDNPRFQEHANP